jgi:hypothetical protein
MTGIRAQFKVAARISQNLVDYITVHKPAKLDRTPGMSKGFTCPLKPVDLLWDPPHLLFNGSPVIVGRTSIRNIWEKLLYFINTRFLPKLSRKTGLPKLVLSAISGL